MNQSMNVAIVGTGYVGLTTGVVLAYIGHKVISIDKDHTKISMLKNGESPIYEAYIETILKKSEKNIVFTTEMHQIGSSEVIIIAVGTPPKPNGEANMQFVEMAAREIAYQIVEGQDVVVVVKSTVPIGSNRRVSHVMGRILRERNVKANVKFASNPEFLREGMALCDTFYPDRVVIGSDDHNAIETLKNLYLPLLKQTFLPPDELPRSEKMTLPPLVVTDATSAEMVKYAANAFLATKISFINEIAGLCEKVGADVTEVAFAMGLDSRIGGRFLAAGLGWGGSCFPKDTLALQAVAAEYGYSLPIIQAAREVNARQRTLLIEKLQTFLKVIRGRTIAVLGLSFKPRTDDVRDSPGVELVKVLLERGAQVRVHDPVAMSSANLVLTDSELEWAKSPEEAIKNADAVLLATEWEEYLKLDWQKLVETMRNPIVIDGRNMLDSSLLRSYGYIYAGIGIPDKLTTVHEKRLTTVER
jgi:UDPglucose 6-dehydrogenase